MGDKLIEDIFSHIDNASDVILFAVEKSKEIKRDELRCLLVLLSSDVLQTININALDETVDAIVSSSSELKLINDLRKKLKKVSENLKPVM